MSSLSSGEESKRSLFIRGIPQTTTNDELLAFFSNVGPVRSCFIGNPHKEISSDSSVSSKFYYGFVRFITQEDAKKALVDLKSKKFKGSLLKLEFALKRHSQKKDLPKKFPIIDRDKDQGEGKPHPPKKGLFSRCKKNSLVNLFISSLPSSLNKKQLFKKFRKFGSISTIEFPIGNDYSKCTIKYTSKNDAKFALSKVNDHIFKGSKITASLYHHPSEKSHRLIIRNLPFSITEDNLQDIFSPFGKIIEIKLPLRKDDQASGFGFVQFQTKPSAEDAIAKLNGSNLKGRIIAVDFAINKDEHRKLKALENEKVITNGTSGSESQDFEDEVNAMMTIDSDQEDGDIANKNDAPIKDDENISVTDDEETCTKDEDGTSNDLITQHIDKVLREKTLFIRNLLFETTEDTIKTKFAQYGAIKYVKIVKDALGRSKGCAFLSFREKTDAERCINSFRTSSMPPKFIDQANDRKKSSLDFELYENLDSNWIIDGRHVDVLESIPKVTAKELALKTAQERQLNDKRNLYLLKESRIDYSSAAWKGLSESDKQKRIKSTQERALKLKKNLNCFVSKTRLSIRNLPNTIDEADLKKTIAGCLSKAYPEFKPSKKYIRQIKLMKDPERKWPDGKSRNLGYGFVELSEHKYALALVRKMDNKDIFSSSKKLIVEFAIENSTILAKRKARNELLTTTPHTHNKQRRI